MPTCQPVTLPLQDIVIFGPIMRQEIGRESKTKATHAKNWVSMLNTMTEISITIEKKYIGSDCSILLEFFSISRNSLMRIFP